MKLTKETLKRIIKEELEAVMDEGSLYTPNGRKEILNPQDESEETLKKFRSFGIRNPKAVAAKRLKDMAIPKPEGNYQWSFVVPVDSSKPGVWAWAGLDRARDSRIPFPDM
jgi:hypothetical protein